MGIEFLTEEQYRSLQQLGEFDTKTSSWGKHLLRLETVAALSSAIAATIMSSSITTVRNSTMPPWASVAR
jgi:Protein of unknown function (DUF4256)